MVGRQVSNYWLQEPFTESWGFEDAATFTIHYFPYRLEDYLNGLCAAGFRIERVHEPRPAAEVVKAHPELQFMARIHAHSAFVLFVGARKI